VARRKGTISRMSSMSHPYTVAPTRNNSVRRPTAARAMVGSEMELVEAKVLQRVEVAEIDVG
jgi:pyridoxal biosynthesis lyase PdxS